MCQQFPTSFSLHNSRKSGLSHFSSNERKIFQIQKTSHIERHSNYEMFSLTNFAIHELHSFEWACILNWRGESWKLPSLAEIENFAREKKSRDIFLPHFLLLFRYAFLSFKKKNETRARARLMRERDFRSSSRPAMTRGPGHNAQHLYITSFDQKCNAISLRTREETYRMKMNTEFNQVIYTYCMHS